MSAKVVVDFYDKESRMHSAEFSGFSPNGKFVIAASSEGHRIVIPSNRVRNIDRLREEYETSSA